MRPALGTSRVRVHDPIEQAVDAYRHQMNTGAGSLEQFWTLWDSSGSASTLAALVKVEMERRFEGGERPRVAEYLERFPVLTESPDRVVSLIYEEFCLLDENGWVPDSQEFCEVYEPWRDSIHSQLVYHRELSRAIGLESPKIEYPRLGERFDKYQLESILGRGGVARVFLATEDDLAGRKVVLKVSSSFGLEPTILAKLDHPNIVKILTVAKSSSGLKGICMPYRPGITLEDLIKRVGQGPPPRKSRAFWQTLRGDLIHPDDPEVAPSPAWQGFPLTGTYVEAVAWIGVSLAGALSYLHKEQVLHRDIKPANVLLAYKEGPQLLDFNLAQDPNAPDQAQAAMEGGTLPYMAPEQLQAFLDPSKWDGVGAPADLYALGLVLREMVTGLPPVVPSSKSSKVRSIREILDRRTEPMIPAREINPAIPPSFDAILEKCLSVIPSDRYAEAEDLADDLQCFLDRQPLRHAPNRSIAERVANFLYRNRSLASGVLVATFLASTYLTFLAPRAITETPPFQRAVENLDSDRAGGWVDAREAFEKLHQQQPRSAWTSLYLALALEKIGGPENKKHALTLIEGARDLELEGVERAAAERLKKDSRSVTTRLFLGLWFGKVRRWAEASESLKLALEIDPDRVETLIALAWVDRSMDHLDRTVEHLAKAIEVEIREEEVGKDLYVHRSILLGSLAKLIDPAIDANPGPPRDRERTNRLLAELIRHREGLDTDLNRLSPDAGSHKIHRYMMSLYDGIIACCTAVLRSDIEGVEATRSHFDRAEVLFREALDSLPRPLAGSRQFADPIEDQRAKLKARRARILASAEKAPAIRNGAGSAPGG